MSVEDKIRRAEEIYNRKRENEYRNTNTRVRVDNTKSNSNQNINQRLKKMIIQIIVCMIIYLTFHYIINNNYIFSVDFKNKCQEILSYDISFSEMYRKITETVTSIGQKYQETVDNSKQNNNDKDQQLNQEQQNDSNEVQENQEEHVEENDSEQENTDKQSTENNQEVTNEQNSSQSNADENIGGAVEKIANTEENAEGKNLSEEDQMKKDAEEIKSKVSFIKPLEGTITSVFGWRNPTVSTVSKYHTGIDIAANEGTDIVSATKGTVVDRKSVV